MGRKSLATLAGVLLCVLGMSAHAQVPNYGKVIKSTQNVGVLGKDLAGDSTNFHTGTTSFEAQDLAVPGNNGLSVAVGRSYGVGFNRMKAAIPGGLPSEVIQTTRQYAFGDWDLDVPSISGVFFRSEGWQINSTTPLNRCSVVGQVTASGAAATGEAKPQSGYGHDVIAWSGNALHVPGGDQTMLLATAPNNNRPTSGGPYHWVTKQDWWVSCLSTIANGTGEGFLAIAPDGTKYWFNWISKRNIDVSSFTESLNEDGVSPPFKTYNTYLDEFFMLPTRVEDRFGNWVQYSYSADSFAKLLSITSSDGRQLTLTYNAQGFVDTLGDGTRTVRYEYNGNSLSRVVLPDNSAWQYGFTQLGGAPPQPAPQTSCDEMAEFVNYNCIGGFPSSYTQTGYAVHPSGARIDLKFGFHFAPTVPPNGGSFQYSGTSVFGVTEKVITGPGIPSSKWYYAFAPTREQTQAQCRAGACPTRVWTDEVSPDYRVTRRMYGLVGFQDQGLLLQQLRGIVPTSTTTVTTTSPRITRSMRLNDIDIVDDSTSVTNITTTGAPEFYEEVDYSYRIGSQLGKNPMGILYPSTSEVFWSERRLPVSERKTYLQGETFTWQANTWDGFDRALSVSKVSTLNPGKTDVTAYQDDLSRWVLGQVKSTTTDGTQVSRTDFDANVLPWKTYAFGKLQQTLTYNLTAGAEAGTLKTVTDGRNLTTTLSQWKRGIPQLIQYADSTSESAVVNNVGWLTSVTDANGYTTGYDYDTVGRLKTIDYPDADSVAWANTTLSFAPVATAEYGIPAGHWKQTISTGNGRQVNYFDAMWRPVVSETFDAGNVNATLSQTVKRYDGDGNTVFQSYALRGLSDFNAITQGIRTTYDGLGRAARVEQDSELGVLATTNEYLDGFQTRVTNPRGYQTLATLYQAYDRPTRDWPVAIAYPSIGAYTDIVRDTFGKPLSMTRRNVSSTLSETRSYVYSDAEQQLCIQTEPETGSTVFKYDAANNIEWSASGVVIPTGTSCADAKALASSSGRLVARTYDARNRIKTLVFTGGLGNQTWTYTPDGLPESITTDNSTGGTQAVNAYSYNKRRLLTGESLEQPGWYTWSLGYTYNANGHLATVVHPGNETINYAPNALGQATQATSTYGNYATGVSYFPNGAIKQFTYGNGIVHTLTQNTRGLPDTSCDSYGACGPSSALNDGYDYDANGNVAAISDGLTINGVAGGGNRTMTYDSLDRLKTVASPMYGATGASYTYDLLDNLTRVTIGGTAARDHYYCYDADWRLTNVKTTSCNGTSVIGLGYDAQGNLDNKNGQNYDFDFGNRLRVVTGKEHYRYDGYGRRILSWSPTLGNILSQYGQDGVLRYQQDHRKGLVYNYIYLGGSLVATRETPLAGGTSTLKYQHTDSLGSPVAVTDASRNVIERSEYEPFGKVLNRAAHDGPAFTGHVEDAATGLTYMQQRYYDSQIGRFLSVDPVTANGNTGGNFNRYWYANNNPYRFVDPDGRKPMDGKLRPSEKSCGESQCSEPPPPPPPPPPGCGNSRECWYDGNKWHTSPAPDSFKDMIGKALDGVDVGLALYVGVAPKSLGGWVQMDMAMSRWKGASRPYLTFVRQATKVSNAVSAFTIGASSWNLLSALHDRDKAGAITSGMDLTWGVIGTTPWGWPGAVGYGGTKLLLDIPAIHNVVVTRPVDFYCSLSGEC